MGTLTAQDVLERAEALVEPLASRAADAEKLRRLTDDTMQDLVDSGLLGMVVPTSLGGSGLGLAPLAEATRIMAHGCPASAWTISFLIMHGWLLAKFPEEARAEFFSPERPWALAPAPLAPTGTATAVDGGYVVKGKWEWATAVCHSDWVMVHAVEPGPEPVTHFVVVPIAEAEVEDVWFTSGMCATGSNTVRLRDVFVPAHRTLPAMDLLLGSAPVPGDGMAGLPVVSVLATVAAAPALGAAETAVDFFRRRMAERLLVYSMGERQKDAPASQIRLASAMSDLAGVQARWAQSLGDVCREAAEGEVGIARRVAVRLAAAAIVRSARSVISTVCEGSGASVYQLSSPLQRLQRDVEVLKGHVIFDWDRTAELAGRVALGMDLRPLDMV